MNYKFCLYLFFILFNTKVFSQNVLDISNLRNDTLLINNRNAEILVDTFGRIKPSNILGNTHYKTYDYGNMTSSPKVKGYWIKFHLYSKTNKSIYLEMPDWHLANVALFRLAKQAPHKIYPLVGMSRPFSLKPYYYKNFLFRIDLKENQTNTYYIYCSSKFENWMNIQLKTDKHFINYALKEYYLLGLYYGMLFIVIIYNLILFIRLKEKVYLLYAIYVCFCALNSFTEDGLGFQFLWPNHPSLNVYLIFGTPDLLLLAFIMYSTALLKLNFKYPKVFWGLVGLWFLHVCMSVFYVQTLKYMTLLNSLYICIFLILFVLGIKNLKNGESFIKYYVIGCSFIIASFLVFYLRIRGIEVFSRLLTIYSFNVAFILEIIAFSFALGERIRAEKSAKELAQLQTINQLKENEEIRLTYTQKLEEEVKARTEELQKAYEEIHVFNSFLKEKNLKLETDVLQMSQERVHSKLMSMVEFRNIYSDEEKCKEYLFTHKWTENKPFKCIKCGHDKEMLHEPYTKRCAKCKYVESTTANTIFHGLKIPLPEAFYMIYAVFTQKNITAEELSKETDISERSCSVFKKKIQEVEAQLKVKQKKLGWEAIVVAKL
ncbi:MAG: 7TM diverse intracellular signaling domain-containing protein [Cytophagales bacterium]